MKTRIVLMAISLGISALSSCSKEESLPNSNEKDERVAVRFSSHIVDGINAEPLQGGGIGVKTSKSDVGVTLWNAGDEIGIYMIPVGETETSNFVENNVYTATNTGKRTEFKAKVKEMYFPRSKSHKVDLLAYYPYNTNIVDYIYKLDLSKQQDQSKIDLLYCKVGGQSRSKDNVELKFNHVLSNLIVKVELDEGITKPRLENVSVAVYGMNNRASFNLLTGALDFIKTNLPESEIRPYITDNECNMLIFPEEGSPIFQFRVNTSDVLHTYFEWKMEKTKFEAGKQYIFTIKIGINGVKSEGEVTDWEVSEIGSTNINID